VLVGDGVGVLVGACVFVGSGVLVGSSGSGVFEAVTLVGEDIVSSSALVVLQATKPIPNKPPIMRKSIFLFIFPDLPGSKKSLFPTDLE
jgi:hypothetical protein